MMVSPDGMMTAWATPRSALRVAWARMWSMLRPGAAAFHSEPHPAGIRVSIAVAMSTSSDTSVLMSSGIFVRFGFDDSFYRQAQPHPSRYSSLFGEAVDGVSGRTVDTGADHHPGFRLAVGGRISHGE